MGIWESVLQYYKARLGEMGKEGKDGTDSPWNSPNEPNSNPQRQSTSRFYSFGGPIGGVASRVLNAVSRMVTGAMSLGTEKQDHISLSSAVESFLRKNSMGPFDDILKAYASYIDESMKNTGRRFHVGYGGIRSPESFITYGMMKYERKGDGERYSITLNPMLKYLSKISGKAKEFAAYTLIHEMTHIYMMAVGEDTSNEGMVNAIASEILERLYPQSDIAERLKMVYKDRKGGLPISYAALNLFAPYVHETRRAFSTLGNKIKYYVSKAVSGMSRYVSGHGAAHLYSSLSPSYS